MAEVVQSGGLSLSEALYSPSISVKDSQALYNILAKTGTYEEVSDIFNMIWILCNQLKYQDVDVES